MNVAGLIARCLNAFSRNRVEAGLLSLLSALGVTPTVVTGACVLGEALDNTSFRAAEFLFWLSHPLGMLCVWLGLALFVYRVSRWEWIWRHSRRWRLTMAWAVAMVCLLANAGGLCLAFVVVVLSSLDGPSGAREWLHVWLFMSGASLLGAFAIPLLFNRRRS